MLVEQSLAGQSPELLAETMAELQAQLHAIALLVPAPAQSKIREVPIWVHGIQGI